MKKKDKPDYRWKFEDAYNVLCRCGVWLRRNFPTGEKCPHCGEIQPERISDIY